MELQFPKEQIQHPNYLIFHRNITIFELRHRHQPIWNLPPEDENGVRLRTVIDDELFDD